MKLLGIDYGKKKIGIAFSEGFIPTPLPKLTVTTYPKLLESVVMLCSKLGVEKVIIGLPASQMDEEIKLFGQKLTTITSLPVEYIDETLTTYTSTQQLIQSNTSQTKRREMEDSVAASLILTEYIENHREGEHTI